MTFSAIIDAIKKAGINVGDFFAHAVQLGNAVHDMWAQCGKQTLLVASQVFYDVIKSATLAEQSAQAATTGTWVGAVQLSQQTIASVNQLVTDFKTGEKQIVEDFKILKYEFTTHVQ